MGQRYAITDAQWQVVRDLLPGKAGDSERAAADNRLFVDAVLWIHRMGAPWRDLSERFGR